ncbi:MAG: hypothetical protein ABWZ77_05160 [Naasia sp.]
MNTLIPGADLTFAASPLQDRIAWSRAIAGAGNLVPAGFRDGPNANPAKILLAVEYGAMLGLHPMAALAGIHVIDGKPTLSAALMSAQVHRAGHQLRITTSGSVTGTGNNLGGDFVVTVTLVRRDDPNNPFVVTWTIDRAKRAGLWGKGNWSKYPENQMTWRAVSEATRNGAPEVLLGVWYTPDELGATVDEDGDVIDAEEVSEPPKGNNGKSGRANETEVNTRSDEHDTRIPGPGSTPSGTVDLSGAGRDNPPAKKPPTASAASWARDIAATKTMDALTDLRRMAIAGNALDMRNREGDTVDQLFVRRRDELLQEAAGEPEPVIDAEDIDLEEVPF